MTSVDVAEAFKTVVVTETTGETTVVVSPSSFSTVATVEVGKQGPAGAPGPPKAITIALPKAGDEFTLLYTQQETYLTRVVAVVRGVTPSAGFELRYGSDRSTSGTLATVPAVVTNTTVGAVVATQNMPIPANTFLWIVVTSVTGQTEELNVCVEL